MYTILKRTAQYPVHGHIHTRVCAVCCTGEHGGGREAFRRPPCEELGTLASARHFCPGRTSPCNSRSIWKRRQCGVSEVIYRTTDPILCFTNFKIFSGGRALSFDSQSQGKRPIDCARLMCVTLRPILVILVQNTHRNDSAYPGQFVRQHPKRHAHPRAHDFLVTRLSSRATLVRMHYTPA